MWSRVSTLWFWAVLVLSVDMMTQLRLFNPLVAFTKRGKSPKTKRLKFTELFKGSGILLSTFSCGPTGCLSLSGHTEGKREAVRVTGLSCTKPCTPFPVCCHGESFQCGVCETPFLTCIYTLTLSKRVGWGCQSAQRTMGNLWGTDA